MDHDGIVERSNQIIVLDHAIAEQPEREHLQGLGQPEFVRFEHRAIDASSREFEMEFGEDLPIVFGVVDRDPSSPPQNPTEGVEFMHADVEQGPFEPGGGYGDAFGCPAIPLGVEPQDGRAVAPRQAHMHRHHPTR